VARHARRFLIADDKDHSPATASNGRPPFTRDFRMNDYLFLTHRLPQGPSEPEGAWPSYLDRLRRTGHFSGGSAIGGGLSVSRSGTTPDTSSHLTGYIRVSADSIDEACKLLEGHPVIEAGGTVEVRELPRD